MRQSIYPTTSGREPSRTRSAVLSPHGPRCAVRLGALLCAASLCLTGCGGGQTLAEAQGETAQLMSAGTAVEVSAVTRAPISTENKVTGTVAAEDEATVMVAVSARCTATYAEAGDQVVQGQILCTLDLGSTLSQYNAAKIGYDSAVQSYNDQTYLFDQQIAVAQEQVSVAENQIAVTREQIAVAEGQIPVAEQQIPMTENQIALLEQQIETMKPRLEQAEKNVADTTALLALGAASQMELDNARMSANELSLQIDQLKYSLDQTKLSLSSAKLSVDQLKAQVDQSKFSLTQLEVQRDNARVQVEQLKSTKKSTVAQLEAGIENARSGVQQLDDVLKDVDSGGNVIAPISGTLVTFSATEGNFISNAMPLAVIDGEGAMKLTASVSEALVPKLNTGDEATVYISSLNRTLSARIRSVERSANVQTKLYTVTLSLPDDTAGLLAGMSADVTFHTDREENAVVIPSEAILTSGDTEYVYIVVNGDTARYVEITTGLTGSGVTQVLSGLSGGEPLVTVGQAYLNDGDLVRIVTGA